MERFRTCKRVVGLAPRILLAALVFTAISTAGTSFHFTILGDRTGEAQPGVYEQVWREMAAEHPAFVLSVGDSIQGIYYRKAEAEWREFERIVAPYRRFHLYLTPGNHDIWSRLAGELYVRHAGHPEHYSFDYQQAHVTILNNSQDEQLSAIEMDFLEADLKAHAAQKVKIIVSHRPSWLIPVVLRNSHFPLHELAKRYGVRTIIAGHVHQMLHFELDGVTYISAPSSGGHLRGSEEYTDGWFFAHLLAEVTGADVKFTVREAKAPHGQGRVSDVTEWGGVRSVLNGR